ncbi:MAG: hypothetical protein U0228_31130 [Myxococcaceae bacterium]
MKPALCIGYGRLMADETKAPTGDLAPLERGVASARPSIEGVAAVAGAFGLVGYVALRAHHNWLGLPLSTSFEVDRYLMASLAFTRDFLIRALVWLIPSLLVAALVERVTRWILESRKKSKDLQAAQAAHALDVLVTALQVGAMLGFAAWTSHLGSGRQGVALGVRAPGVELGRVEFFYEFLVAALIITIATRGAREVAIKQRPRLAVWRAMTMVLLMLQIPQAYGVATMSVEFPTARVALKEGTEPRCGLLVGATADTVTLWELVGNVGQVAVLPRDAVTQLTLGRSESILTGTPTCQELR